MNLPLLIGEIVALVAIVSLYQRWLRTGMRARVVTTRLSAGEVEEQFADAVAIWGWSLAKPENPQGNPELVARQGRLSGWLGRQEITCTIENENGRRLVRVTATRVKRSIGGFTQAHTVRIRMNRFLRAIAREDASATVGTP